jgi:hypothetical protein
MIIRLVGVRSLSTTAACAKVRIQEIRIFDEFLAHNKRQGAPGRTFKSLQKKLVLILCRKVDTQYRYRTLNFSTSPDRDGILTHQFNKRIESFAPCN